MGFDQTILQLPPQQQRVVRALLEAKSVKEIACELNLSTHTVKDYIQTIYGKFGVHSARELMLKLLP